jgi:hypothetical protein
MSGAISERGRRGWGRALLASAAAHAIVIAIVAALARRTPRAVPRTAEPAPETAVEVEVEAEQSGPAAPPGTRGGPDAARPSGRPKPSAAPGAPRRRTAARDEAPAPGARPAPPGAQADQPGSPEGLDLSLRRDPTAAEGGGDATRPRSLLAPPASPAPAHRSEGDVPRTEERPGFVARVDPDGTVHFHDKLPRDANDAIMRLFGMDPYSYEKRRFADDTRAARERMKDAARAVAEVEALQRLPSVLERLWQDVRIPAAARRHTLFDLWDECLDPPPESDAGGTTDPTLAGAARMRALIREFIRSRLPPDGPDAFPPDELDELNRRRTSRERFDPYGQGPP